MPVFALTERRSQRCSRPLRRQQLAALTLLKALLHLNCGRYFGDKLAAQL